MRNSLTKMQYLLYALLLFALTACGTTSSQVAGTNANTAGSGKITANVVLPKSAAKTVGAQVDVVTLRLMVTGATIPTAKADFASNTGGSLEVFPGRNLIVTAQAFNANGVMLYEGFALNVTVDSGVTTSVTIQVNPPVVKADEVACLLCHQATRDIDGQNLIADYKQSGHYTNNAVSVAPNSTSNEVGCAGCHGTQHNDLNPADSGRCAQCHTSVNPNHTAYTGSAPPITGAAAQTCGNCHVPHNFKLATAGCIGCHSIPQNAGVGFVQDNNGVRSIAQEFTKWSHHVTGVTLNDAHCAACHLEGTIVGGAVVVDPTMHAVDASTHLRDTTANTDADFAWNPAAPNHSGMDTYCMSCHDSNGAVSPMSTQIQAFINANGLAATGKTASPTNPFGDTISNRYDKMQRPAVVDASSQFNTTNNSHHAVKGQRYSGRTRAAGPRQITSAATFANNSSALLQGVRSTIYDAGNLNALYSPLGTDGTAATGLGDDSTLHCGDCHTVGQWKVGSSDTANGSPTPAAIGAHGSNNEYLLRNTLGTDERHTQNAFTVNNTTGAVTYTNPNGAFLVCYNCHNYNKYGSIFLATGVVGGHVGEYDAQGRCNGVGNTLPFNGYTTGTATDGTQFLSRFEGPVATFAGKPAFAPGFPLNGTPPVGEQNPDFGDIFGIQCANCHNSGIGNAYGGIHGSANNQNTTTLTVDATVTGGAYIDGMGNTTKIERFLPGLGNAMHVPGTLGGFVGGTTAFKNGSTASNGTYITGGISNDTNWEQRHWQQTATTVINNTTGAVTGGVSAGAGCYTLGGATAATSALRGPSVTGAGGPATTMLDTWGGCDDHGAKQGNGDHGFVKKIVRPVTY